MTGLGNSSARVAVEMESRTDWQSKTLRATVERYAGRHGRNPDVEINTETGEVRIKGRDGEVIENLDTYLNIAQSTYSGPQIDWSAVGAGSLSALVIIGTIIRAANPLNAAMG